MEEPIWLNRLMIDAMHFDQLQQHGGIPGVKDENALEAALARPKNKLAYEPDSDIAFLAAAYGFGLATTHSFSDGKKRIAFVAMYTFLGLNALEIVAQEPEVVKLMVDVASHNCTESNLAIWLRAHIAPFAQ